LNLYLKKIRSSLQKTQSESMKRFVMIMICKCYIKPR